MDLISVSSNSFLISDFFMPPDVDLTLAKGDYLYSDVTLNGEITLNNKEYINDVSLFNDLFQQTGILVYYNQTIYTSPSFYLGGYGEEDEFSFHWNTTIPDDTSVSIQYKIGNTWTSIQEDEILTDVNNTSTIQYRIILTTADQYVTPILHSLDFYNKLSSGDFQVEKSDEFFNPSGVFVNRDNPIMIVGWLGENYPATIIPLLLTESLNTEYECKNIMLDFINIQDSSVMQNCWFDNEKNTLFFEELPDNAHCRIKFVTGINAREGRYKNIHMRIAYDRVFPDGQIVPRIQVFPAEQVILRQTLKKPNRPTLPYMKKRIAFKNSSPHSEDYNSIHDEITYDILNIKRHTSVNEKTLKNFIDDMIEQINKEAVR